MKKLMAVLALLLLSSCFEAEDISKAWDQGKPDPALLGTWQLASAQPNPILGGQWQVQQTGSDYTLQKQGDTKSSLVRSLTVGPYQFLMAREGSGTHGFLCRYIVAHGVVGQYELRDTAVLKWVQATDPKHKNIVVDGDGTDNKQITYRFRKMNDGAIAALAAIPNTAEYWNLTAEYKKVQ